MKPRSRSYIEYKKFFQFMTEDFSFPGLLSQSNSKSIHYSEIHEKLI